MKIDDAIRAAKAWIADLYKDEMIGNVGLEEVRFDDRTDAWEVTIGFNRKLDDSFGLSAAFARPPRLYKVVRISNDTGTPVSLTDRQLDAA